jgi:hypothetical protein
VASYDVAYTRAGWNSSFAGAGVWHAATTGTTARFVGTPGSEYCFTVRARDGSGNLSDWSAPRCTTLPVDDRSLIRSAGWTREKSRHSYRHTALQATRRGAMLRARHAMAGKAALLIDRGRHYGSVVVRYNGHIVKTARLAGKPRDAVPVSLPDLARRTTVTITTTSNRTVRIDGLWIAPTP